MKLTPKPFFVATMLALGGIAGHVDDDRGLERIVREGTGPGRRAATGDGQSVARTAETVGDIVESVRNVVVTAAELWEAVDSLPLVRLPQPDQDIAAVRRRAEHRVVLPRPATP